MSSACVIAAPASDNISDLSSRTYRTTVQSGSDILSDMPKQPTAFNLAVSARLKRLHKAVGLNIRQFAEAIKCEEKKYDKYYRGIHRLPPEVASDICTRFPGVTSDWLYKGKPELLSFEMAKKLGISAA